jgi:hypothetical protein
MARTVDRRRSPSARPGRGPRRWIRALRAAAVAAVVAAAGLAAWHGGVVLTAVRDHPYFRVARIEIHGGGRLVGAAELRERSGVREGSSLWNAAPGVIEARLEAHPMIAAAAVRRLFPDTLEIRVRERRPAAITVLDDLYYLDRDGASFGPLGPQHDRDYPVFTGVADDDEAPLSFAALDGADGGPGAAALDGPYDGQRRWALRRALQLLRRWDRRPGNLEVSELHLDPRAGLILHPVEPQVPLYLGWRGWERRLHRAEAVLDSWRGSAEELARIDLRFRGQVVVELRGRGPRGGETVPAVRGGNAKVSA